MLKKHHLLINSPSYRHKTTTSISSISLAGQLVSPLLSSSQAWHSAEFWVNGTCHHGGFRNTDAETYLESLCSLVLPLSVNFPFHRLVNPEPSYRPQPDFSLHLMSLSPPPCQAVVHSPKCGKEKNSKKRKKQAESPWKQQEDKWIASNLRESLGHLSVIPLP